MPPTLSRARSTKQLRQRANAASQSNGNGAVVRKLTSNNIVRGMPPVRPFMEMGVSGTVVYPTGYIQTREKSVQWIGQQKYITIADMAVNTSIVAAGVHYFLNLLAHPQWSVRAPDDTPKARELADFVEEVLHDLTLPWSRVVRRAGTFRFYGFGIQEWTAQKRKEDNKIVIRSIEPRPQASIERWEVSDIGELLGVYQRKPKTGELIGIPRAKFVYLVEDTLSDSPEGLGIFRHLADPWERLKTYYRLEAQAFERDLRGIPVGRIPYTLLNQAVKSGDLEAAEAQELVRAMEDFVQLSIKQTDTSLTLDSAPYESQAADGFKVAAVPQWGLELLQGSATGVEHIDGAINRTQHEMARILTTEHLLMGQESGNRSLSEDKSRNLALVANSVNNDISAAMTHDVIDPLWQLNGFDEDLKPEAKVEDVAFKDGEMVARILRDMATAGAVLAPDDPVIEDVRELVGVSPPPELTEEMLGLTTGAESSSSSGEQGAEEENPDELSDEELKEAIGKMYPALSFNKGMKTLFVKRALLNAGELHDWARSQGFTSALAQGDMHVTLAHSKELVDWSEIEPLQDAIVISGGAREVHQFAARQTANGAVVLRFFSNELEARWNEFLDAGAVWDFDEYIPHVTLTYSIPELPSNIVPYDGPLIFGPEELKEVNDNWTDGIIEEALKATSQRRARRARRRRGGVY